MPLHVKCPGCGLTLGVPDNAAGKTVRCSKCSLAFQVPGKSAVLPPAVPSASLPRTVPPPLPRDSVGDRVRAAPPRPAAPLPRREEDKAASRREPRRPVQRTGLPPAVWIGGGLGAAVVLVAGVVVLCLALPSSPPGETKIEAAPVAQAPAANDVVQPVIQPAVAPAPAPGGERMAPVVAAGNEGEEFVDLPERQDKLPVVAGLGNGAEPPGPGPGPGPQGEAGELPRVTLFNGRAARVAGRVGMAFRVAYRFEQGAPFMGGARYSWVIQTGAGRTFRQLLMAGELRAQGMLQGRAMGAVWFDRPYQTYLAVERFVAGQGWQEQRISDVLTIN